jgi:mono/diheme cytochrome c family protein
MKQDTLSAGALQEVRVRKTTAGIIGGLVLVLASAPALAEEFSPEQIAKGRGFAQNVCSACHVVTGEAGETPVLRQPGPSFSAIAKRPEFSTAWLRGFLKSNHSQLGPREAMPNPTLADYQIDELVAYFWSLK